MISNLAISWYRFGRKTDCVGSKRSRNRKNRRSSVRSGYRQREPNHKIVAIDRVRIQQRLRAFDFIGLFTQELMWNHFSTRSLELSVDGVTYVLKPVA